MCWVVACVLAAHWALVSLTKACAVASNVRLFIYVCTCVLLALARVCCANSCGQCAMACVLVTLRILCVPLLVVTCCWSCGSEPERFWLETSAMFWACNTREVAAVRAVDGRSQ